MLESQAEHPSHAQQQCVERVSYVRLVRNVWVLVVALPSPRENLTTYNFDAGVEEEGRRNMSTKFR